MASRSRPSADPTGPALDAAVEHASAPPARQPGTGPGERLGRRLLVTGVVQGVGFRPFVWRLASELGLDGRVRNRAGEVEVEVAGPSPALAALERRLVADAPPRARVEAVAALELAAADWPAPGSGVVIEESEAGTTAGRLFPPDIATCDACLRELADPADRRYRYPFINCTNCGPRATIIEDLPYDRARTSMRDFPLCGDCGREYGDPADRRFHAEPVACPRCGPRLAYRRPGDAAARASGEDALQAALADLRAGRIVAIKGLGGYHLACDATDRAAVDRLRDRKQRWAKPFAVMVRDLAAARRQARVSALEARLLSSPARPIVLLDRRPDATPALADSVVAAAAGETTAPSAPAEASGGGRVDRRIGLFLPYTPLHHLLLEGFGRPIVLTSGNVADEPLATDDAEALERLGGLADAFLQHDREIRARYDDSVTRAVGGRESIVRRARGYAPEPLPLPVPSPVPLLAVGAELKHTFTLAREGRAHVAPHTGDLEDLLTHRAFEHNLAHLERLLALEPMVVAHDLHPAYLSTQYAVAHFPPDRRIGVQHHHAHVVSAAAEAGLRDPFIGVAYDGLGMGDDGTFWGGELLVADLAGYRRVARFGLAPLPGGAMAVRKPYRMALGFLFGAEDGGAMESWLPPELATPFLARLDPREVEVVRVQVARGLNAPLASSAGRLFDAAAALLRIRDVAEYEAQAAIELELLAEPGPHAPLPYRLVRRDGLLVLDPRPILRTLLAGLADGVAPARLAARFQETMVAATRELVGAVAADTGLRAVCLSGGVFQNQWLASTLARRLGRDGLEVHLNRAVPANDGGISFGQAAVAAARLAS
ncbi:MAG TPA: carbamoyltransferase HypF [Candidatus Limnocylindrales bacterium]